MSYNHTARNCFIVIILSMLFPGCATNMLWENVGHSFDIGAGAHIGKWEYFVSTANSENAYMLPATHMAGDEEYTRFYIPLNSLKQDDKRAAADSYLRDKHFISLFMRKTNALQFQQTVAHIDQKHKGIEQKGIWIDINDDKTFRDNGIKAGDTEASMEASSRLSAIISFEETIDLEGCNPMLSENGYCINIVIKHSKWVKDWASLLWRIPLTIVTLALDILTMPIQLLFFLFIYSYSV
jgi:hypothetical protein